MQFVFGKNSLVVRFGTEKTVGFPRLSVIFDKALTQDSFLCSGRGGGYLPRIFGLVQC
jgi:hypothetical protein